MRNFAVLFTLSAGFCVTAAAAPCDNVAERLRPMVGADQAVREGLPFPPTPKAMERMEIVDRANTLEVRRILNYCGWPRSSGQGKEASNLMWLLVQHADRDRSFQKVALHAMSRAVDEGEASARDLAYLSDRINTAEGRPQLYGTQLKMEKCSVLEFFKIDRREDVEKRRAKIGLPPLEEYEKFVRQQMGPAECSAQK